MESGLRQLGSGRGGDEVVGDACELHEPVEDGDNRRPCVRGGGCPEGRFAELDRASQGGEKGGKIAG